MKGILTRDYQGEFFNFKHNETVSLTNGKNEKYGIETAFGVEDIPRNCIALVSDLCWIEADALINGEFVHMVFKGDKFDVAQMLRDNKNLMSINNKTKQIHGAVI